MTIKQFIVGPVQTNCYFIINDDTKEILIVDPGASGRQLARVAKDGGYTPRAILLTHGHFDHADGIEDFIREFPGEEIKVYAHEAEKETLADPSINLSGEMGSAPKVYHADVFLCDDEKIELAGFEIRVLFTPGHTAGGCCFYFPKENAIFCGDTLFEGSIGRSDFPGGSLETLVSSIKEKIFTLGDDVEVFPGHQSPTTVGEEKRYNPFVR